MAAASRTEYVIIDLQVEGFIISQANGDGVAVLIYH
jgi:hypothetical protein